MSYTYSKFILNYMNNITLNQSSVQCHSENIYMSSKKVAYIRRWFGNVT